MRERGIIGHTRRRRRSLTKQDPAAAPVPDLIGRDFTAPAPGQRLVGDITYLPTAEGWLYLATAIDLFNREVVGHAMAEHMRAELVSDAVALAHHRGLVAPDATFHSDRGSQPSSTDFRATLKALRTSINVSDIDKSSVGKVIDFSPRRATWIRFQVSGGSGLNVGLSEIEAFPPA